MTVDLRPSKVIPWRSPGTAPAGGVLPKGVMTVLTQERDDPAASATRPGSLSPVIRRGLDILVAAPTPASAASPERLAVTS